MIAWKLRDVRHSTTDPKLASEVSVFAAPGPGQTFQNTGQLLLTEAESDDLAERLKEPLTPREYDRLITFLTEWEEQDEEARKLAEIVRMKLGRAAL